MKILYVDDESTFLDQAKIFLEKEEDLDVDTASSAKKGLEKMEEVSYDAIVSDYRMPEMDGLDFLRVVREERDSDIPFIIFTGKGREEVAMEALNLGADRYLQKGGKVSVQYGVLSDAILQEVEHRRTERESEKSKKKFEASFDASPNLVFFLDENGVFEDVNETALDKLGFSKSEIVGSSLLNASFLSDKSGKIMEKKFESRVEGNHVPPYPAHMKTKSGEVILVEINVGKLDYGETFQGEIIIARPLTEQEAFDKKYHLVTEELSTGIYIFQDEGFQFINEALRDMMGYSLQELEKVDFLDLIHPDHREEVMRWAELAMREEISDFPEKIEIKVLPKDGGPIWVRVTISEVQYGEEFAVVGNVTDITERKKAELELKEAKNSYEEIFEKSADALFVLEPNTARILAVNQEMCRMYGYSREEVLEMEVEDFSSGEYPYTQEEVQKRVQKARSDGPQTFEWVAKKKDGTLFWVEVTLKEAEINGDIRILASVRDISERKEMEENLRESEEKYRVLVEQSRDGIYIYRGNEILFVNDRICEVSGYSKEELYDMSILDLVPSEEEENMRGMREKRFSEENDGVENTYETRAVAKDGEIKDVEVSIRKIDYKGKPAALGIVRDITQRKKREEELRTMKNSVESSIDGIAIGSPDGELKYVNPSFLEMWGFSEEDEILGEELINFCKDKEKAREVLKETKMKGGWRGKLIAEREDGSTFPVEVAVNLVKDEFGETAAVMASLKDITKRKEAEEREEFLHSLLRHDLKNKAQVVLGYLENLDCSELSEEMQNYIKKSDKTLRSCMELIEEVRNLREVGEEGIGPVDLKPAVKNAISEIKSQSFERGIDIESEVEEYEVIAGSLLEKLFSNIIENSIKHSGCEEIRICSKEEEGECIITFEDDGSGIPQDKREKIFERGYKFGDTGGSGLGAYLVKEIAESYGGSVEVKDSEMGGACFDVRLEIA